MATVRDRKLARLKYTVDKYGPDWYRAEVEKRAGFKLEEAKPYELTSRKDYYGWEENHEGKWYYTLFMENGRILDSDNLKMKTALLEIAKTGKANFRFTCNQNLILSDIDKKNKTKINKILEDYGLLQHTDTASVVRKNAMACVALNTCPLALAEAQRYFPSLISKIEPLLANYGLSDEDIIMRMTGCPNGCARPYAAEIGFVGTALGRYNLHIGGDHLGTRLNQKYRESLDEQSILQELDQLFLNFSRERNAGERFGDYTYRKFFN